MNTLRTLYWESTRWARFVTIILCTLAAAGVFLRRNSSGGDLHLIFHMLPWSVWVTALLFIAAHRYWCLWHSAVCGPDCLETVPGTFVCVLALFVWTAFLVSSAIASDFGLALMLIACAMIEMWLLARHIERLKLWKGCKLCRML